ncbi:MAG: hypothetical protein ABS52_05845 [Gemmatimonadetes bacterium SCN 70-22]|nr:MAG: hypothetical protein ABS52_05845 [Gemmatimonadetes bacterium SCN 70-22]
MTAVQPTEAARTDSLHAILDSVFASPAYRWEGREDPFGTLRRLWFATGEYLQRLREQNPDAYRLLMWALVAVLLAILAHAAWVALRTIRRGSGQPEERGGAAIAAPRDAGWYASEAARLAGEGDYVAAMQADFLRLVLELDARRVVAFHPSKTPSEYARDASLTDEGRRALLALVRELYGHAFARVPCDRAAYESWRARALAERYAPAH